MPTVRRIDVGELSLQCTIYDAAAGPSVQDAAAAGPRPRDRGSDCKLVVLLHGFPECAATWSSVAPKLADAGYRVVAPDLRGYGGSDRPRDVEDYGVQHLAADVAGLVRAMGVQRAHVVGHDWGAAVAWWTAMVHPEVIAKLAIINGPHPVGYARALRTWEQFRRSWYVFFFQIPFVPELLVSASDFASIRRTFARDGVPDAEVAPCVDALRPDGAVGAAIAYYRAAFRKGLTGAGPRVRKVDLQTLVLWGEKDHYLEPALADPPADWVPNARVVRLPDVTHWAQIEAADVVARELLAHFKS